jgi:Flp pilus assembly protein TadG
MHHSPIRLRLSTRSRRGSLTVEMLLVVVVLAIVTVAVVQFGVFFANAEEVAMAARSGALEASQHPGLAATATGEPVPTEVISAIEHQLLSSQIQWHMIRLEHNVAPAPGTVVLESDAGGNYVCEPKDELPGPPFTGTRYVRVTVCVPLQEVIPRALSYFGEQLFVPTKTYEHTVVLRYELGTP